MLVPGKKDVVIIDTTAGVEHFGRGIDRFCNLIIGVVDPTYESLAMADQHTEILRILIALCHK